MNVPKRVLDYIYQLGGMDHIISASYVNKYAA